MGRRKKNPDTTEVVKDNTTINSAPVDQTPIRETVISFVGNEDFCQIYTNQVWARNLCKKMLQEHPEDCTLIREYPEDGTIEIRCPVAVIKNIKYPKKMNYTEEQLEALRAKAKKMGEARAKKLKEAKETKEVEEAEIEENT